MCYFDDIENLQASDYCEDLLKQTKKFNYILIDFNKDTKKFL